MKHLSTIFFSALMLLAMTAHSQSYYYSPEGKTELEVSTQKIVVKFNPNLTFQEQVAILEEEAKIGKLDPKAMLPAPKLTLVPLEQIQSEQEVYALIKRLEQHESVRFANHFLEHKDGTLHGVTDQFLIRLNNLNDEALLQNIAKGYNVQITHSNEFDPLLFHLTVTDETPGNALEMANKFAEMNVFAYAEPDFLRLMKRMNTNDPNLGNQWALNNTGSNTSQYNGIAGADMNVFEAWSYTTGSSAIKVAILDEGVDLNHPDLVANMVSGYDGTGQGSAGGPSGDDAHGTACAGIVASVGNNGVGTAGVAYGVKIIPVRIAYDNGSGWVTTTSWIGNSINWAWNTAGADVLSNSWGGGGSSSTINNAISGAVDNGRGGLGAPVLFAAGNSNGANSYPATYEPTISVIAMSMCNQRKSPSSCDGESWWGSNYGNGADVAAPGVKIYATDISGSAGYSGGDYVSNFNGTSSACPNAAGAIALVLSANPGLTEQQARFALENNCDKVGGYSYSNQGSQPNGTWSEELGYGRVNAAAAVASVSPSNDPDDAGITAVNAPVGTLCETSAVPQIILRNFGSNTLNSVQVNYQLDDGPVNQLNWTGALASFDVATVSLPSISFSEGNHTLSVFTTLPNGQEDTDPSNDAASSDFNSATNSITLNILLDNYPGETSWEIRDQEGSILASGGNYGGAGQGALITESICAPDGCFDFTIFDSYGDGVCCGYGNGSYSLVDDATGEILASGGAFGSSETTNFCLPVVVAPPLAVSIGNSSDVSCNGGNNGSATAIASGGSGTYNYSWSNGESSALAISLPAGTHTVTVSDGNTTASTSVNISEPAAIDIVLTGSNADIGNNGSASAEVNGGTSPYTYLWSTGATERSISDLAPDTYELTVTDANGCTSTASITIEDRSTPLTIEITNSADATCNGGSDGSATANAAGGTGAYSYNWSNGEASATATNLSAGTHTVTVSDGLATASTSVTITEPDALVLTLERTPATTVNNGSASASTIGGTAPYTYIWSTGATEAAITGLLAGDYSTTVTDANGCSTSASVTVEDNSAPLAISITNSVDILCNGSSEGMATASAAGGSGSYTFAWSNGNTTATASNLSAGTYSVTVDDGYSTATTSVIIEEPAALELLVTGVDATDGVNGSATAAASGGTEPYSYLWSTSGTTSTISGLTEGTYDVTVTDANGCSISGTVVIIDLSQGCTSELIDFNNFESGWGIWNDGGSDCRRRKKDRDYANGKFCIRLRDNTSTSVMTTDELDMTSYEEITVDFTYITRSMDNANEDFWLQISDNGGASFTTVASWNLNDEFVNNQRYYESVTIPGTYSANTKIRFRCDASGNKDWVYIDDVSISGCGYGAGSNAIGATNAMPEPKEEVEQALSLTLEQLEVYPNPTDELLFVNFTSTWEGNASILVFDFTGRQVLQEKMATVVGEQQFEINTSNFGVGMYIMHIVQGKERITTKFAVTR